jgi:glycosyltransferase involved in cell wall biosynthesis
MSNRFARPLTLQLGLNTPMSAPLTSLPKIMFYTHGLVDGGGERLWACLASAFKQRGYPVIFVQDFEADDNRHNLDPEIKTYTLGQNHFRATRRLAAVLAEECPAVALSGVGGSNSKLMAALRLSRAPTEPILTYHGFREWQTGFLSFATYVALPALSARAARIVAVSGGLREQLVHRWRARPDKTVCIHNPVFFPANAAVPTKNELSQRDDVVLAVGRFVGEKDFITLLRAFARLDRPAARLVILGKGPQQARIESEIARLGLKDRVSLPGYSREPWTYYAQAKCFVSSSSSEPFGNVVVEAMAYGLPVVATACDGPQEILKHGVHGRIVSIGDHIQLAHAIADTLDDPGDPALRRARADEFSFAVRVPAYVQLIDDVLKQASRHHDASGPAITVRQSCTLARAIS